MKHRRILSLLLAGILLVAFGSCKKEVVPVDQYATTSHVYTVSPNQWSVNNDTYIAQFKNVDITEDVMNNGTVNAAMWDVYDARTGAGSWNPLPYVYPYYLADEDAWYYENVRFEYEQGRVVFVLQDLNRDLPAPMDQELKFKVTVIQ